MSRVCVLSLVLLASATAVGAVAGDKRRSLLGKPSPSASDEASLKAGAGAGLDAKAYATPLVVNHTEKLQHFGSMEEAPPSLKDETKATLKGQSEWLPEALRTGQWPEKLFEPYLVWCSKHKAYVSNTSNAKLFAERYPEHAFNDRPQGGNTVLRTFLGGMARAELPAIITAGSLLAFVRQGTMMTDDFDFLTFTRFLKPSVTESAWWGQCMHPKMGVQWAFGEPSESGYELAFERDGMKVDLFFAEEEADYYSVGFWVKQQLYRCVLPGPTAFAPAMDVETGARFFISTTALLDLEYQYGAAWFKPYTKNWHWARSPAEFASCDMDQSMDTHRTFSEAAPPGRGAKHTWDATLGRLERDESDSRLYKAGTKPEGGQCPFWD